MIRINIIRMKLIHIGMKTRGKGIISWEQRVIRFLHIIYASKGEDTMRERLAWV